MKKQTIALAAALAVLVAALAGCAGNSTGGSSAPASQPASQSASLPASVPASQPEHGDAEGAIAGTVVDATMNTVTIQVPDGSKYSFATEGAEIDSPEGLLIGDAITLHYTGTFNADAQQQDVTVSRIVVDSPASTPGGDAGADSGTEDVQSIQGTLEQYDGDTMMIVDATGVDYVFSLTGADLHVGEEGFAVGDTVVIFYTGALAPTPDVQDVTVGEVRKAEDMGN